MELFPDVSIKMMVSRCFSIKWFVEGEIFKLFFNFDQNQSASKKNMCSSKITVFVWAKNMILQLFVVILNAHSRFRFVQIHFPYNKIHKIGGTRWHLSRQYSLSNTTFFHKILTPKGK